MSIEVTLVAFSINKYTGTPLYTFALKYPRMIHQELMTHRVFSRNASSSRAIPIKKLIKDVEDNLFIPQYWGKNQRGMQAREEIEDATKAKKIWTLSAKYAVRTATKLADEGIHKQITNRVLEPYMYMRTLVTATDWEHFLNLRDHEDAQPEIQQLAAAIRTVIDHTRALPPEDILGLLIDKDGWHLPYVTTEEYELHPISVLKKISVARCARVSYLNHEGTRDVSKDVRLYQQLQESGHWSPFEHVARPLKMTMKEAMLDKMVESHDLRRYGNFKDWIQFRKDFKDEFTPG